MPKKRHQVKYSKPQSTPPASLAGVSAASRDPRGTGRDSNHQQDRSVNELLADLRRTSLTARSVNDLSLVTAPSVPPLIRQILQLPETEPPAPRRPARRDPAGRRLPPGPAPPRSWLSQSRHAPPANLREPWVTGIHHHGLPGARLPSRGGLTDMVLRRIAVDWEFQRSYNHYYLYAMPSHLRVALVAYLVLYGVSGVSLSDLQAILVPPTELAGPDVPPTSSLNEDIHHIDLTGCLGSSIKLRELSSFLFPVANEQSTALQESWDAPGEIILPLPLLPNLTHLSLALNPGHTASVSWKHLLAFCANLPTLTHLSLAYWPEPSLTPNAKFAAVISPQGRTVQYGGTGPYSHSLDHDWSEAIIVLRRASKKLYSLEYLDLTGCSSWFPALMETADRDTIDWVGDWGKITTLVLRFGYDIAGGSAQIQTSKCAEAARAADGVERHIRARRAGRGRRISVERDKDDAFRR